MESGESESGTEGVASPVAVEISGASIIGKTRSDLSGGYVEDLFADFISRIELTHPRFLRATPAHRVMECGGRVLRTRSAGNFSHSRQVEKIGRFISHSWQASPFLKVLTLQMLYNWKPAVLAGNAAALLGTILFSCGFLPGFQKAPRFGTETLTMGPWSLAFGLLGFLLVWFLRAPREMVFLDKLCINQEDHDEKMDGVLNIGACLKNSNDILVIFDETYCGRLWCLFELAAFLTTHEGIAILVGPMVLTVFLVVSLLLNSLLWFCSILLPYGSILTLPIFILGLCCYGGLHAAVVLRHSQNLDLLNSQLQHFAFEKAMCHCCSVNHHNPENPDKRMPCDRVIMRKCVQRWFGSVENFDRLVQTKVKDALNYSVGGQFCPYPLLMATGMPLIWACMDFAAARFLQQDLSAGFSFIALGLAQVCLSSAAGVALIIICIRDWVPFCPKMLQKPLTVILSVVFQGLVQIFLQIGQALFRIELVALIFASVQLVPCVLLWRCANRRR